MPLLVGGLQLKLADLKNREDAQVLSSLSQMLSNAEYWLSFDVANFESLLAKSPSPLRELGVAIALRFSERIDGSLGIEAIERAKKELIEDLSEDLKPGIAEGLDTLERAINARERAGEFKRNGFRTYSKSQGLSVHALRAAGRSKIDIEGATEEGKLSKVPLGEPILIKASDERGRPLAPAEVESRIEAPLLIRDESDQGQRTVVFLIPGEYNLQVPGRASGNRKVVAR